jgi:glutaredoxin-like protein
MPILDEKIAQEVSRFLADLPAPVRLVLFTQEDCLYCADTRTLVEEIAALSDRVSVEVYDLQADHEQAAALGVDKTPAIAIIGAQDYGVRFYGIPSGYEFSSLLYTLRAVSSGQPELSPATLAALEQVDQPVHFQVFVTPSCPYCPQAVLLAHHMAIASPMVRSDMVEAMEFPDLANQYQVMGVPRTVINETVHIEGAAPEGMVLAKLQEALAGGGYAATAVDGPGA